MTPVQELGVGYHQDRNTQGENGDTYSSDYSISIINVTKTGSEGKAKICQLSLELRVLEDGMSPYFGEVSPHFLFYLRDGK